MGQVVVSSWWSEVVWKLFDLFSKLTFGWLKRKIIEWANKKLKSGLSIIDQPKVFLDGLSQDVGQPFLSVTISLFSTLPTTLLPNRIIGRIEATGLQTYLNWDFYGKNIFTHTINNINLGKNSWIFNIPVSVEILEKNVKSNWYLNFVAIFHNGINKTFKNIIFKIRESDVKRIYAHMK